MTHEEVRECMSEYDVDNGEFCQLRIILNSAALAAVECVFTPAAKASQL